MTTKLTCNCYYQCGCVAPVPTQGQDCDDCFSNHSPIMEEVI